MEMSEGVQGEPPRIFSRGITKLVGHPGMTALMNTDGHKQPGQEVENDSETF
jgi:hypothetical protein